MTNFGKWLQMVPPLKVALGVILLSVVAVFSLGAATNGIVTNLTRMPERLDAVEATLDTVVAVVDRHIEQDSVVTNRIFCVVVALADDPDAPINPLDPCRRQ